jgi:transposase
MRKVREVLRLSWVCGLSQRQVAVSCGLGRSTVGEYLERAAKAGVREWSAVEALGDEALGRRLFPPPVAVPSSERPEPDWARVHLELRRKGVTLRLLWEEYQSGRPEAYRYSRFCELYGQWRGRLDLTMRQEHTAGEKLFVDYAGPTVPVVDRATGELREAQIFVAVLGASNYTYAEGTWSQGLQDWIGSHVRTFEHLGAVPWVVVPDNLKSGVTRPCYYDPDLNPTYHEMAVHYGVAVVPARVRKPRDKDVSRLPWKLVRRHLLMTCGQ